MWPLRGESLITGVLEPKSPGHWRPDRGFHQGASQTCSGQPGPGLLAARPRGMSAVLRKLPCLYVLEYLIK